MQQWVSSGNTLSKLDVNVVLYILEHFIMQSTIFSVLLHWLGVKADMSCGECYIKQLFFQFKDCYFTFVFL